MKTQREKLIAWIEELLPLLENRSASVGGTDFLSAQQPFAEVASWLWHLRRGKLPKLWSLATLCAESGPLARLAENNAWQDEFRGLRTRLREILGALNRIRYHGSDEPVELGDQVSLRVFFRRTVGRVVYLPGVSAPRPAIDFDGLFHVAIRTPAGSFVMPHVDPDNLELGKGIRFLRRDKTAIPAGPTDEQLES
jgi:hypothetical protein